jgi:hypothetical protein
VHYGLPCRFIAIALRVSVKRLNWGVFGFFVSVFFKSVLGPPRDNYGLPVRRM